MQCETEPTVHLDQVRRFFPEWADRAAARGPLLESESNSYLAGGYSEEFGYCTSADGSRMIPMLRGDPELCGQWWVEIGCLHPGYPECPRPRDRGHVGVEPAHGRDDRGGQSRTARLHAGPRSGEAAAVSPGVINAIPVPRSAGLRRSGLSTRLATAWIQFRVRRRQLGSLF